MNLFKLFFKLVKNYRYLAIPHLLAFAFLFVALIFAPETNEQLGFYDLKIAVSDQDNTLLSRHLKAYILDQSQEVAFAAEEKKIEDIIFEGRLDYAAVILPGFESEMNSGNQYALLKIFPNHDERINQIIDARIESYLGSWDSFRVAYGGVLPADKAKETLEALDEVMYEEISGSQLTDQARDSTAKASVLLRYLDYVLIGLALQIVGRAVTVMEQTKLKNRDLISGTKERKRSKDLFFASFVITAIFWFILAFSIVFIADFSIFANKYVIWMLLSSFAHLIAISALVLLLCQIFPHQDSTTFLGTFLSLALAFGTGIFVPRELIWQPLLKFFSISPTYWNVSNQYILEGSISLAEDLGKITRNIAIMLLMALVYFLLTISLRKKRLVAKQ